MEIGLSNVVQIVMDNALICKVVDLLIEIEFPLLRDSLHCPYS